MNRHTNDRSNSPIQDSRWTEVLVDRSEVEIRMIDPAAVTPPVAAHEPAHPGTGSIVFVSVFGQVAGLPTVYPDDAIKPIEQRTFVAVARDQHGEHTVGVGELRSFDRGLRCRCDVQADRKWIDKGLGIVLMRHLIWVSAVLGMQDLRASCANGEYAATDLLLALGFRARRDDQDPTQLLHELYLTRER